MPSAVTSWICTRILALAAGAVAGGKRHSDVDNGRAEDLRSRMAAGSLGASCNSDAEFMTLGTSAPVPIEWNLTRAQVQTVLKAWQAKGPAGNPAGLPGMTWQSVAADFGKTPPKYRGKRAGTETILSFMSELLSAERDPFGGDHSAVPWTDLNRPGVVAAVTQRQMFYVTARTLLGDWVDGGGGARNGLWRAIQNPRLEDPPVPCPVGLQAKGILAFLAATAIELADLGSGCHGNFAVLALPVHPSADAYAAKVRPTAEAAAAAPLATANVCLVGNTNPSRTQAELQSKVSATVLAGRFEPGQCLQPTDAMAAAGVSPDFMQAPAPGMSVNDIAGADVGGGGVMCYPGAQDETMVATWSEIQALVFWTTALYSTPASIFGIRRYRETISGNGVNCAVIDPPVAATLNPDLMQATKTVAIPGFPRPVSVFHTVFSAVASAEWFSASGDMATDVEMFLHGYDHRAYHRAARGLFATITSLGMGPWGAGVWGGAVQYYYVAVWVATTVLAELWKRDFGVDLQLKYYVYNDFCEHPSGSTPGSGCALCSSCNGNTVEAFKWLAGKPRGNCSAGCSACLDPSASLIGKFTRRFQAGTAVQLLQAVHGTGRSLAKMLGSTPTAADLMHWMHPYLSVILH